MKHISRKLATALLATTMAATAGAQEMRSTYFLSTNNFRHQMNPALLDDAYFSIPFFGQINVGATGNVGLKNFVYKLDGDPRYKYTTFMNPNVSAAEFLGDMPDRMHTDVYLNYNLFSVGFRGFGGVNLIELNLRSNTNIALPKELFEFMKCTGEKEHYQLEDIGVRSQSYAELALGHSHKINDRLTVGGKVKFLVGGAYGDLSVDKLDITMNGDQWRIQGDARVNAAILDATLEYEDPSKNAPDGRRRVKGIDDVAFSLPGFGVALDLGATFKLNEDLTLSAAVTDLGAINWKKVHKASSMGDYTFDGFTDIYVASDHGNQKLGDQFESLGDDLEEMFSVYEDGEGSKSQTLAATINVGAEYTLPVYRRLRFGALYTGRLNGIYSHHQGMFAVTVNPLNWFELSLNTAVGTTGWTTGGAMSLKAKHFNFYIASDRLLGKVSKEFIPLNQANANVSFGMTIPL